MARKLLFELELGTWIAFADWFRRWALSVRSLAVVAMPRAWVGVGERARVRGRVRIRVKGRDRFRLRLRAWVRASARA